MIQEKDHGVWGHELRPERITMEKHPIRRSTVGGQAVMEGVMMKSPEGTALAVRQSDGSIVKEFIILQTNISLAPSPPGRWCGGSMPLWIH